MTVWTVSLVSTDGCTFDCLVLKGVFSSKDKAETYALEEMEASPDNDYAIEEYKVDEPCQNGN